MGFVLRCDGGWCYIIFGINGGGSFVSGLVSNVLGVYSKMGPISAEKNFGQYADIYLKLLLPYLSGMLYRKNGCHVSYETCNCLGP